MTELSIVIPAYNRKEMLKECLFSLDEQAYPNQRYEIIVVDDGSSDGTIGMLDNMKKRIKNLRYLEQAHKGPAAARNLGAGASSGEIIGFIDDDCTVDEDWVRLMLDQHRQSPGAAAVGGGTLISTDRTTVMVSQFLSTCSIEVDIEGDREVIFFPTCNVSFKRRVFGKHRFDERFPLPGGEDLEFFWRLFKDGCRFCWCKDAKVTHHRYIDIVSFIRQAYIYGRGNILAQCLHRDHPLLEELRAGRVSFWVSTMLNIVKISYFSHIMSKKFIKEIGITNMHRKVSAYLYFMLHKIFYISGNIAGFLLIERDGLCDNGVLPNMPRLLILDITHSCNLSCRICDIWKTAEKEGNIKISYIKKIFLQAKKAGIREIALSGGEPLLRKDIFRIFELAKHVGIKNLGVLTNGILLRKYMKKLMPYILDNTISPVISFDSLRPEVHNYIRNSRSAWREARKSLEALSLTKKEHPGINFNVITIILNQNLEELIDMSDFIKSLGVNSLQFQALLSNNLKMSERKNSPFWPPDGRLALLDKMIDSLIGFKRENPQFIRNSENNLGLIKRYYRAGLTSESIRCLSADKTVLISNEGECVTCFSSYGDIKKQSLIDILTSNNIVCARKTVEKCSWPCLLPCFCDLG